MMKHRYTFLLTILITGILLTSTTVATAALSLDVPGYEIQTVSLGADDSRDEGPALAAHPSQPWLYIAVDVTGGAPGSYEGYNDHQVWKIDFSSDTPTTSLFSSGAYRNASGSGVGNDVLDSLFGSAAGLAVLADGSVAIIDNFIDSEGRGDTIYRARDLNDDGDALDVVDVDGVPTTETLVLIEPIETLPGSGWGGFAGVQCETDPQGNLYVITSDGSGLGEILIVDDPTSVTPSIHAFQSGFDFGSGLAIDVDGTVYAGNVDLNFFDYTSTITIYRMKDTSGNGTIEGGESDVVSYDQLPGLYDLTLSPSGEVFLTSSNEVRILNVTDGTSTLFAHDPSYTFLSDLTFVRGWESFAPFSGPTGAILVVADPNSDGTISIIYPATVSGVPDWRFFR